MVYAKKHDTSNGFFKLKLVQKLNEWLNITSGCGKPIKINEKRE
jgi:hypothetical protein